MARKRDIQKLKKELDELKEKRKSIDKSIQDKEKEIFFRLLEEYDTDIDKIESLLKEKKNEEQTNYSSNTSENKGN